MPTNENPTDPRVAARILQKLIRDLDPEGIARARKFIFELQDLPDPDVPKVMVLMKCQHVIAKEMEFDNWDVLRANEYGLSRRDWTTTAKVDFETLYQKSLSLPPDSVIKKMMDELNSHPVLGYARGTREDCEKVLAWIEPALPPERKMDGGNRLIYMAKALVQEDEDWDSGESQNMLVSYNEETGSGD